MNEPCEVGFSKHSSSDPTKRWRITAPGGRVLWSCDRHLDSLLYLEGVNEVELVESPNREEGERP